MPAHNNAHQPAIASTQAPGALGIKSAVQLTQRRKPSRDLSKAENYRPQDIWERHGIPKSTVCQLCRHPDPNLRMPSFLIPGRCGRKGSRLIPVAEFAVWLARWRNDGQPAR